MTTHKWRVSRRAAALFAVAFVSPAFAAGPREALQARELFESGRALAAKGEHERACPLFEEALLLVNGTGTMYNLADCWERIGRSGSAYEMFMAAATAAERDRQGARARVARERAQALEPQLTRLRFDVGGNEPGLRLRYDERELEGGSLHAPLPVDPGRHRITATAPGRQPWSYDVDVPPGAGLVIVTVPRLEPVGVAAPSEPPKALPAPLPPRPVIAAKLPVAPVRAEAATEPVRKNSTGMKNGGGRSNAWVFTVGGVGVAVLGAAGYSAFRYKDSNEDAAAICPANYGCSGAEIARHAELVSDAKRWRLLTYVGAAVGAASVGTATLLLLSGGGTSVQTSTGMSADGVWLTRLEGSF